VRKPTVLCLIEPSPHFHLARTELSEAGSTAEREESLRHDAATIWDTLNSSVPANRPTSQLNEENDSVLTVTRRNLSQLVAVCLAHQTKHAAKSVKTRSDPQDSTPKPTGLSDRQRLCAQMAEVVRRAGTGLERDARWKTGTAPGTRGPHQQNRAHFNDR
jgi:protein-tyrosine-phosphatase